MELDRATHYYEVEENANTINHDGYDASIQCLINASKDEVDDDQQQR
jgi:hypothetical protein